MDALYYNGFKLAYRRYGASDAPAVVLIMGLGMSSAAWPTSLIAHLVREGFQVITPDNRDCGESSRCTDMKADGRNVASAVAQALLRRKVTSAYALEDMALDVERLLNHLSIRRAHIVGISMGGMIAPCNPPIAWHRSRRSPPLRATRERDSVVSMRSGLF